MGEIRAPSVGKSLILKDVTKKQKKTPENQKKLLQRFGNLPKSPFTGGGEPKTLRRRMLLRKLAL